MALLLNRAGRRAGNMLSTLLLRDAGTSRYLGAASIVQKEDNGGSFAKDFASAESSREASSPTAASRGHGHAFAASLVLGAAAFYSSLQQVVASKPALSEDGKEAEETALRPNEWVDFKLQETYDVNHNTKLFRFSFDPEKNLGLNVASCLLAMADIGTKEDGSPKKVIRPYTPISPPDSKGYFDLMIKVYPQGLMSQHIAHLKPGDTLAVKGPIPKLPYEPNKKKQIGMIAGGTGVTPMLQVLDAILSNPDDNTQVSLVFANTTPDDILLKEKLDRLASAHPNFKVFYVVDKPTEDWKGGRGYINKDVLLKALPSPSDDTVILVCGPPGLMKLISGDKAKDKSQGEVEGLLKDLGYPKEQVYKF
ncbi:hypothetical protein BDL97_11G091300 [Sphagnum fallax]|nr:hypothetical protein BDL97_11G091300 [Sphagnum fallax]